MKKKNKEQLYDKEDILETSQNELKGKDQGSEASMRIISQGRVYANDPKLKGLTDEQIRNDLIGYMKHHARQIGWFPDTENFPIEYLVEKLPNGDWVITSCLKRSAVLDAKKVSDFKHRISINEQ